MENRFDFIGKLALLLEPEIDLNKIIFKGVLKDGKFHLNESNCLIDSPLSVTAHSCNYQEIKELDICKKCLGEDDYILNAMFDWELSESISGYRHLEFMLNYWSYETFCKEVMGNAGISKINNLTELEIALNVWDDYSSEVEYGLYHSPGLRIPRSDEIFAKMYNKVIENLNDFQNKFFMEARTQYWFKEHFFQFAGIEASPYEDDLLGGVALGPQLGRSADLDNTYYNEAEKLTNVFGCFINWEREFLFIPYWVFRVLKILTPDKVHSRFYKELSPQILETAKVLWDKDPKNIFYDLDNCIVAASKV